MLRISLNPDAFAWRSVPYEEIIFLENVVSYELEAYTSTNVIIAGDKFNRLTIADVTDSKRSIYLVVETLDSANFGHFFWESVVFLGHFNGIKNWFPNIIFLVKEEKKYISSLFKDKDIEKLICRYPVRETQVLTIIVNKCQFLDKKKYEAAVRKMLIDSEESLNIVRNLIAPATKYLN